MADEPEQPSPSEEEPLPDPRSLMVLLAIVVEGGLILAAWGLGWLFRKPPLEKFFWDLGEAALGAVAALPLLGLFFVCLRAPVGPFRRINKFFEDVLEPLLSPCTLIDLAGISLLAGVGEEMFFRGVLQAAFTGWMGVWAGLALASVLFGLLHAITPTYALLAAVMGAYLGVLWHFSGNLLTPILAHALYDFLALVLLLRVGKGERPALPPGSTE
jgi:membrane protease YdiL (CAAX protease family)